MNRSRSPFRNAFREARIIAVIAVIIALGFTLFAANSLPFIRELPAIDEAPDSLLFGGSTMQPMDGVPATMQENSSGVDTGMTSDETAAKLREEEKRRQDSIKKAERRKADSIAAAKAQQGEQTAQVSDDGHAAKGVGTAKAKQIFDAKNATFIDARRPDQFAESHIPGALSIYAYDFAKEIPKIISIPRDKLIVVYCDGGLCELSHELADELIKFGFQRVVVYTGGMAEWTEKNYPLTSGG